MKILLILFFVILLLAIFASFLNIFFFPYVSIYIFFLSLPLAKPQEEFVLTYFTPEEEYQQQLANNDYILPKI